MSQSNHKARTVLRGLLKHERADVRKHAAEELLALEAGDEPAIAVFLEVLKCGDANARDFAALKLGSLGGRGLLGDRAPAVSKELLARASDSDPDVRGSVLHALVRVGVESEDLTRGRAKACQ